MAHHGHAFFPHQAAFLGLRLSGVWQPKPTTSELHPVIRSDGESPSLSLPLPLSLCCHLTLSLLIHQQLSPALEDCLKLLREEQDERRLAGLLLATKLFQGDGNTSFLKVYEAVGTRFLDRLLMIGELSTP